MTFVLVKAWFKSSFSLFSFVELGAPHSIISHCIQPIRYISHKLIVSHNLLKLINNS